MIDVDLPKWKFLNRVRLLLQSDAEGPSCGGDDGRSGKPPLF